MIKQEIECDAYNTMVVFVDSGVVYIGRSKNSVYVCARSNELKHVLCKFVSAAQLREGKRVLDININPARNYQ